MKVSVVTVSLNSMETIERTVRSVRTQSFGCIEHVLVDGLSTDGAQEYIGGLGDTENTTYVKICEKDSGIYDAMNKGVQAATGDFVIVLNADDWLLDADAVARFVTASNANAADIYFSDVLVFNKRLEVLRIFRSFRWASRIPKISMALGVQFPHPGSFVRRELYRDSQFDASMRISADHKFVMANILNRSIKVFVLEAPVVGQLAGGASQNGIAAFLRGKTELYRAYAEYFFLPWALVLVGLNLFHKLVSRLIPNKT